MFMSANHVIIINAWRPRRDRSWDQFHRIVIVHFDMHANYTSYNNHTAGFANTKTNIVHAIKLKIVELIKEHNI